MTLSEQADTSTPTGKMVFTVLGAVAELERSLIAERVRAGLRNARAKGKKLGRPARKVDALRIARLRASGHAWPAIAKTLGGWPGNGPPSPSGPFQKPFRIGFQNTRRNLPNPHARKWGDSVRQKQMFLPGGELVECTLGICQVIRELASM